VFQTITARTTQCSRPFIVDKTHLWHLDSIHRSRRSTEEKDQTVSGQFSLTRYGGESFRADAPRTGCPMVRFPQVSLTLSLYSTKSLVLIIHLSARPLHVWSVAVALSVHLGVYCLVHKGSPPFGRDPLPVVTRLGKLLLFLS